MDLPSVDHKYSPRLDRKLTSGLPLALRVGANSALEDLRMALTDPSQIGVYVNFCLIFGTNINPWESIAKNYVCHFPGLEEVLGTCACTTPCHSLG